MADATDKTRDQNPDAGAAAGLKNDADAAETFATDSSSSRGNYAKLMLLGLLLVALMIGVFYGWQLWQFYRTHESTDDAYVVGGATRRTGPARCTSRRRRFTTTTTCWAR
jgi:hypothetical protein